MGRVEDSKILEEPRPGQVQVTGFLADSWKNPARKRVRVIGRKAEPQKPCCSDFQLWRTLLLEIACTCLSRCTKIREILGQMQVSTGTATIAHESLYRGKGRGCPPSRHERSCWRALKPVLVSANKGRDDPRRRRLL